MKANNIPITLAVTGPPLRGSELSARLFGGSVLTALLCRVGVIEMPLFHVQNSDRPGYIIAMNYSEAESKWREAVAKENDGEDTGPPDGIALVCDDSDLIVGQDWSA